MVTDLFSFAYMKQIYDWCEQHNLKLTGHLLREENMMIQLPVNGACMPHYECFHIPGMDWLGRDKAKRDAVCYYFIRRQRRGSYTMVVMIQR